MAASSRAPTILVALDAGRERRRADRVPATMPVSVDGRASTTADVSDTGLSFHAAEHHAPGTRVEVVIEYLLDGHHYPLRCDAEVVRCEADGQGYVVGAKLSLPPLAPLPAG